MIKGPGLVVSASISLHLVMKISSWPHLDLASAWLRATILALFSRTAVTSFTFVMILLSRVTINQPLLATSGIQSGSRTSGLVIGHAGLRRL
jgi:hypothetical protein